MTTEHALEKLKAWIDGMKRGYSGPSCHELELVYETVQPVLKARRVGFDERFKGGVQIYQVVPYDRVRDALEEVVNIRHDEKIIGIEVHANGISVFIDKDLEAEDG